MTPKIVILGSTGFIGAVLLERLRQEGNLSVEGYGHSDLNLASLDCVEKLYSMVNESTILIVAVRPNVQHDTFEYISSSVSIALNIAQCLSNRPVKKCLYFSSTSVYGDAVNNLSITEETRLAPNSVYGVSKSVSELILKHAADKAGVPLLVLRPCMVYGPGDNSHAYGPTGFIKTILQEGQVNLFGDGAELRDYIFIKDLVEITAKLVCGDQSGLYNVTTGHSHSFKEIVRYLQKTAEQKFNVVHTDRIRQRVDVKINPERLLNTFPCFSFTELEKGLMETYGHFKRIFMENIKYKITESKIYG